MRIILKDGVPYYVINDHIVPAPEKVFRGLPYRFRRGQLKLIPGKWWHNVTTPCTIRHRPSKALHKHRKIIKYGGRSTLDYKNRHMPILPAVWQMDSSLLLEDLLC